MNWPKCTSHAIPRSSINFLRKILLIAVPSRLVCAWPVFVRPLARWRTSKVSWMSRCDFFRLWRGTNPPHLSSGRRRGFAGFRSLCKASRARRPIAAATSWQRHGITQSAIQARLERRDCSWKWQRFVTTTRLSSANSSRRLASRPRKKL